MSDDLQRVKDATDIVEVIGEAVHLRPKGREFVGLCPFHEDHTPSMNVVPHKQMYHCFSCGAGGDVFTFVQEFHKMGFREALEMLAERVGIELTKRNAPPRPAGEPTRRDLVEANGFALRFYQSLLTHKDHGQTAREVITQRGIADAMVDRFQLGVSPDRWDGLVLKVKSAKLTEKPFHAAGLLKTRDSGGSYDALRNRLIFPIHDQTGKVVAFGGRKIDPEDEPKYLNSPETALFNKSETLYGIHQALPAIKRQRTAVIVEGYTDVIACHQAGLENVVGTLGTALTAGHARGLRRLCDTIVLLFDGDTAGQKAAFRGMDRLLDELVRDIVFRAQGEHALDIRFANLADAPTPEGLEPAKDPDELLAQPNGPERLRALLAEAPDLMTFRFAALRAELQEHSPSGQERVLEAELARLNELGLGSLPPTRKDTIAKHLAEASGVSRRVVFDKLSSTGQRRVEPKPSPAAGTRSLTPPERALACLISQPELWPSLSEAERDLLDIEAFEPGPPRVVADAVMELAYDGEPLSLGAVQAVLADRGDDETEITAARRFASRLQHEVERESSDDPETLKRILGDCLWLLEKRTIEAAIRREPDVGKQIQLRREFKQREQDRKRQLASRA